MKNKWVDFRLKKWHFGAAFAVLVLLTNIIAYISLKKNVSNGSEITEIDGNMGSETNFVLFYAEESETCNIMEHNLYKVAQSVADTSATRFNKINITKHPELCDKHMISGIPSILIFKNGQEVNRIVGVVSESNLKFIYRKVSN